MEMGKENVKQYFFLHKNQHSHYAWHDSAIYRNRK